LLEDHSWPDVHDCLFHTFTANPNIWTPYTHDVNSKQQPQNTLQVILNGETDLNTIGAGTQNLMSIFLMLSWSVFSSKYHDVCSLAEAPAVGSGAPHTWNKGNMSQDIRKTEEYSLL
jgi:hypothetical protein